MSDADTQRTDLALVRQRLKSGEYDGADIMRAWLAIDELLRLRDFVSKAFQAHPNLDMDIEAVVGSSGKK